MYQKTCLYLSLETLLLTLAVVPSWLLQQALAVVERNVISVNLVRITH